jgi:hypothetical protein
MTRVPVSAPQSPLARAVAATAVLFALAVPGSALAQDWTSPQAADAAARAWERRVTPSDAAALKAESTAAAVAQKGREDAWDRKMRRTTRSICTGAKGC